MTQELQIARNYTGCFETQIYEGADKVPSIRLPKLRRYLDNLSKWKYFTHGTNSNDNGDVAAFGYSLVRGTSEKAILFIGSGIFFSSCLLFLPLHF